jgi:hypothetical protein
MKYAAKYLIENVNCKLMEPLFGYLISPYIFVEVYFITKSLQLVDI